MELITELEEYVSSLEKDCIDIENSDIGCCDKVELEIAQNVIYYLNKLINKHRGA